MASERECPLLMVEMSYQEEEPRAERGLQSPMRLVTSKKLEVLF